MKNFKVSKLFVGLVSLIVGFAVAGTVIFSFLADDSSDTSLEIVSRNAWQARESNYQAVGENGLFDSVTNPEGVLTYDEPKSQLNTIVVHHSAFPGADVKAIQNLHMDSKGYADIGYHFVISEQGTIYEGRKIDQRGTHIQGHNTGSVGIVLLGNFDETMPSAEQIESLVQSVTYVKDTYDITHIAGHMEYPRSNGATTECPGKNLLSLLPGIASDTGLIHSIDGYETPSWVS